MRPVTISSRPVTKRQPQTQPVIAPTESAPSDAIALSDDLPVMVRISDLYEEAEAERIMADEARAQTTSAEEAHKLKWAQVLKRRQTYLTNLLSLLPLMPHQRRQNKRLHPWMMRSHRKMRPLLPPLPMSVMVTPIWRHLVLRMARRMICRPSYQTLAICRPP